MSSYIFDRLATIEQAVAEIRQDLDQPSQSSIIGVNPSDNLFSLIEMSPADSVFELAPGCLFPGPYTFAKPVQISGLGIGQGGEFLGEFAVTAPCIFRSLGFDGVNPDRTILDVTAPLFLDSCDIMGSAQGQRRGVAVNGSNILIENCHISNIWHKDDAQAICGWDGTEGLLVKDSELQSSGEVIMFGGGDPTNSSRIPSNIILEGNTLTRPLAWRGRSDMTVKNLLEIKNAKHVIVRDNVMSQNWADGQVGYAIVLTVRNQSGTAPYSTIEDILFQKNIIAGCGAGIQILGRDDEQVSQRMDSVAFSQNQFTDIDPLKWGGAGRQITISGGPKNLTFDMNTFQGANLNSAIYFDDVAHPTEGLSITNQTMMEGTYGVKGDNDGMGKMVLDHFAPGYVWKAVTLTRTNPELNGMIYPPGTTIL